MGTDERMAEAERSRVDLWDVMVVVGFVLLAGGLGGYDWRLAAVVCGALLVGCGLWMAARAMDFGNG